jgi:hypothetical protein
MASHRADSFAGGRSAFGQGLLTLFRGVGVPSTGVRDAGDNPRALSLAFKLPAGTRARPHRIDALLPEPGQDLRRMQLWITGTRAPRPFSERPMP